MKEDTELLFERQFNTVQKIEENIKSYQDKDVLSEDEAADIIQMQAVEIVMLKTMMLELWSHGKEGYFQNPQPLAELVKQYKGSVQAEILH